MKEKISYAQAPGRICLFGEHQDYLGLPVIAMAIDLFIKIKGKTCRDRNARIILKDFGDKEEFSLQKELAYSEKRDYLKSVVNLLRRSGVDYSHGLECELTGNIPLQAGTSSSSAMIVAWTIFLLGLYKDRRVNDPDFIGDLGYRAEIKEFNESGGWMDQYTSSFGGLVHIDVRSEKKVELLPAELGGFVLGDSKEPKDTIGILTRVKQGVLSAVDNLKKKYSGFDISKILLEDAKEKVKYLETKDRKLILGNIRNRDIFRDGLAMLSKKTVNDINFGRLLDLHHERLNIDLDISTPKIERMLKASRNAGALGGKINGSGGGGCMFAYAPGKEEEVFEAILAQGGVPYIIKPSEGAKFE